MDQPLNFSFAERAAGVIAAGCDIALHCSGDLGEMRAVADALGEISAEARTRLERAMASVGAPPADEDFAGLVARRDELLSYV